MHPNFQSLNFGKEEYEMKYNSGTIVLTSGG